MSATFEEAINEICDLFYAAWKPLGHPVAFENVGEMRGEPLPPRQSVPWARVRIRHTSGGQASLAGAFGRQRYDRSGVFVAQVFVPIGEGLQGAYGLAKTVTDAFEGQSTPKAVWFRNVRINEVGPDGAWWQVNVFADFTYDEIK